MPFSIAELASLTVPAPASNASLRSRSSAASSGAPNFPTAAMPFAQGVRPLPDSRGLGRGDRGESDGSGRTRGIYLPNGNRAPSPKFDYKLRWFERLTSYAKTLLASGAPAVLAGDFTAMPTDLRQDAHLPLPKTPEGPMLPGNAAESGECRFSRTAFYSGKHALGAVRLPERAYLGCDSVC